MELHAVRASQVAAFLDRRPAKSAERGGAGHDGRADGEDEEAGEVGRRDGDGEGARCDGPVARVSPPEATTTTAKGR